MKRIIFDGGPSKFDGTMTTIDGGGGSAERTHAERATDDLWALARYEPTGETRELEVTRGQGERARTVTVTAEVWRYVSTRFVPKKRDPLVPAVGQIQLV